MFVFGLKAISNLVKNEINNEWNILLSENEMLFSLGFPLNYVNGIQYQGNYGAAAVDAIVVTENKECVMSNFYKNLSLLSINGIHTEIGFIKILSDDINKSILLSIPEELRTPKQNSCLDILCDTKENRHVTDVLSKNNIQINKKNYFFDGYKKPRYVPHDRIHWWVSQALGFNRPTFLSIMISPTDISSKLFDQLSTQEKYSLLFEEAMVLSIERFLIKNSAETNIPLSELWEQFYNLNDAQNLVLLRLTELCTVGVISDHPSWLANWGAQHLADMANPFLDFMIKCKKHMPQSFFDYIAYL